MDDTADQSASRYAHNRLDCSLLQVPHYMQGLLNTNLPRVSCCRQR